MNPCEMEIIVSPVKTSRRMLTSHLDCRAVVERTTKNQPIPRSLWKHAKDAALNPRQFIFCRPFALIWTLYAATYVAANCTETLTRGWTWPDTGTVKFFTTTAVNVPLGIWKDISFARIFSAPAATPPTAQPTAEPAVSARSIAASAASNPPSSGVVPRSPPVPQVYVPASTRRAAAAVFLFRDALTIFGSFTLAPQLSKMVPDSMASSAHAKANISQLTVPALTQLVATPVHLWGLDMYTAQTKGVPMSQRISRSQEHLPSTTVMRSLRLLPAFGIGIIGNTELRNYFHGESFEEAMETY